VVKNVRVTCATMCYMALAARVDRGAADPSVGVRELRQNLSVYLAQVATGTVFRVTDRGHVVALLVPLPSHATTVERLVASGRATRATVDLLTLGPPTIQTTKSLSKALDDIRADRL
jgi:prevent-host-death family protein